MQHINPDPSLVDRTLGKDQRHLLLLRTHKKQRPDSIHQFFITGRFQKQLHFSGSNAVHVQTVIQNTLHIFR